MKRKHGATKNVPSEYIVYASQPSYPSRTRCRVGTLKIPRGKHFNDMRDYLPPTVGRGPGGTRAMMTVRAYTAADARAAAAQAGVRCK